MNQATGAHKHKNTPLFLLTLGINQSSYKYGGFESLVDIGNDSKVIETCDLITKTYEIISKLYGDQHHQLISDSEISLNAELMSISTDHAQLDAMLREQVAKDQHDLEELQIILGL